MSARENPAARRHRPRTRRRWLATALAVVVTGVGGECGAAPSFLERGGLSGQVGLAYFSSNHGIDDRDHFPGANLVLKQRLGLADRVRWVAEARVLAQQIGHEDEDARHGSVRGLRYADEVTSELREGYVELAGSRWELRAGKQIIVWGRADEINPTDVITPKDFLLLLPEGIAGYRYGTTALKLDWFASELWRVTGVWAPVFTPSVIPLDDLPPGARLVERLPEVALDTGSTGVKLDRSGGDVDGSVSYFYGYNLLPEVRILDAGVDAETGGIRATAALTHARQHMIGADFATVRGRFGYRGEIAYVHTDNPNGRRVDGITPYLFYVLGIERTFLENLSVIVQYVGRAVFHRVEPERALADPDPARAQARFLAARETMVINQQLDTVQNGWSLRVAKRFWNDTLELEMLGLHYLERNDFFIRPRLTYALTDAWRATVGAEIFHGPQRSFFGRVERNTGAFIELLYSF